MAVLFCYLVKSDAGYIITEENEGYFVAEGLFFVKFVKFKIMGGRA